VSLIKFLTARFSLFSSLSSTSAHSLFIILYCTCSCCWMLQSEARECILRICYQMKFAVLHILSLFLALLDTKIATEAPAFFAFLFFFG
jgi:hypothetical protein